MDKQHPKYAIVKWHRGFRIIRWSYDATGRTGETVRECSTYEEAREKLKELNLREYRKNF